MQPDRPFMSVGSKTLKIFDTKTSQPYVGCDPVIAHGISPLEVLRKIGVVMDCLFNRQAGIVIYSTSWLVANQRALENALRMLQLENSWLANALRRDAIWKSCNKGLFQNLQPLKKGAR
jgi:hypothetical protein